MVKRRIKKQKLNTKRLLNVCKKMDIAKNKHVDLWIGSYGFKNQVKMNFILYSSYVNNSNGVIEYCNPKHTGELIFKDIVLEFIKQYKDRNIPIVCNIETDEIDDVNNYGYMRYKALITIK